MLTLEFIKKYKQGLMLANDQIKKYNLENIHPASIYYDFKDHTYKCFHISNTNGITYSVIPLLYVSESDHVSEIDLLNILQIIKQEETK